MLLLPTLSEASVERLLLLLLLLLLLPPPQSEPCLKLLHLLQCLLHPLDLSP
jgi:hypothetical protein